MTDRDALIATLQDLCGLHAPSGEESQVIRYMRDRLESRADELTVDVFGNLVATRQGLEGVPRVMVATHADEVGLIVREITPGGFLRFELVGSPTVQLLPGRRIRLGRYEGVVGVKSDHLLSKEESAGLRVAEVQQQYIDVGATSAEEVLEMDIRVGTKVSFTSELAPIGRGRRYAGKSVDNRVGCALLLHLFEEFPEKIAATVLGTVTVQEEVGLRGAGMVTPGLMCDIALIVDVAVCGDTPEFSSPENIGRIRLGGGPVIHVMEQSRGSNQGMLTHPRFVEVLAETAEESKIPYQMAMLVGGSTDASRVHLTSPGIPSCYIGIPSRYVHSPVEVLEIEDAQNTLRLIKAFLRRLGTEATFQLLSGG